MMRMFPALAAPLVALALIAGPAAAQDSAEEEGLSLMQEGAEMLLRGLIEEMGPALEDLQGLADEMAPAIEGMTAEMAAAFAALLADLDSLSNYEMPQMMPNGDIIIRRRPDAPAWEPPAPGEIDL
jgi:hypothetical protein